MKKRERFQSDKAILPGVEGSLSRVSRVKPGGHDLRREVVVHHQRARILDATLALVAESGYRALTVGRIIKRAGVAKLKFYELFSSKEDAFLAALAAGIAAAGERLAAALEGADAEPAVRVEAGIAALLDLCAERPDLARAAVLEAPLLGAAAAALHEQALDAFSPLLDGARKQGGGGRLPDDLEQTVLGGLYWLLYDALLQGRPKRLRSLRPALVEFALLPFLGPAAAARAAAH